MKKVKRPKARNFVAKHAGMNKASTHKDKKRDSKLGNSKHNKDLQRFEE